MSDFSTLVTNICFFKVLYKKNVNYNKYNNSDNERDKIDTKNTSK